MGYQQEAGFKIKGRVITMRVLDRVTQIQIAVNRRVRDAEGTGGWKTVRTDYFVLGIVGTAMRAYVTTLKTDDLVAVEGEMTTTQDTPEGSGRPVNGTRFIVHFIAALPARDADRIDNDPTAPEREDVAGKVPF